MKRPLALLFSHFGNRMDRYDPVACGSGIARQHPAYSRQTAAQTPLRRETP